MGYFLWGSIQGTSEQSSVTNRSSDPVMCLLPLSCSRPLANPFQPNPNANTGLTPRLEFPFLHHPYTRVPLRNTPPQPALQVRPQALSSRPEQRRSLPLRSGGTTATNPPIHNSIRRTPPSVLPPLRAIHFSYPSHSFFLLWK